MSRRRYSSLPVHLPRLIPWRGMVVSGVTSIDRTDESRVHRNVRYGGARRGSFPGFPAKKKSAPAPYPWAPLPRTAGLPLVTSHSQLPPGRHQQCECPTPPPGRRAAHCHCHHARSTGPRAPRQKLWRLLRSSHLSPFQLFWWIIFLLSSSTGPKTRHAARRKGRNHFGLASHHPARGASCDPEGPCHPSINRKKSRTKRAREKNTSMTRKSLTAPSLNPPSSTESS